MNFELSGDFRSIKNGFIHVFLGTVEEENHLGPRQKLYLTSGEPCLYIFGVLFYKNNRSTFLHACTFADENLAMRFFNLNSVFILKTFLSTKIFFLQNLK